MNGSSTTPAVSSPLSSVYGPVRSWRFGRSLGIDPIVETSTCSFNCIYCQLGDIQRVTGEQRVYVPTDQVARDLKGVNWDEVDVVTISGSGEPTLATNLDEIIGAIRSAQSAAGVRRPIHILSNATLFHLPEVRARVMEADVIAAKLDAPDERVLRVMNRPAPGVTLESIIAGTAKLKREFPGKLSLQIMLMPANLSRLHDWVPIIQRIQPDELQLNTPRRPYPLEWVRESRGDHDATIPVEKRTLRTISREEADAAERLLHEATGVPVVSVYQRED